MAVRIADRIAGRPRTALLALLTSGLLLSAATPWQVALTALLASVAAAAVRMGVAAPAGHAGSDRSNALVWAAVAVVAVTLGACVGETGGSHRPGPPLRTDPARLPGASHGGVTGTFERIREQARRALDPGLPPTVSALLVGMALGDDSGLPSSVREDFRRASLTHVTAASGQNVALLLALALPLLVLLGLGLRTRLVACAALACVYVPLAGGESPIRRACVMALAALAARGRGGRGGVIHPLLLAAAVTIALDPSAPRSLGWQLSFAAVFGMAVIGPPMRRPLERAGLPGPIAAAIAVTSAATLVTTPLIAHSVGRVSFVAIPANLLAEPAVAASMGLSLAACLAGQASTGLAAPLAWAAALPAAAVLEVAHLLGGLDWSAGNWRPGPATTIAALVAPFVLAGLAGVRRGYAGSRPVAGQSRGQAANRWPWRRPLLALTGTGLAIALAIHLAPDSGSESGAGAVRALFLDVGQGDAELLADGETGILVDTGPPGTPIARMVEQAGVKRLAALVLTHGQADHAGAVADLLTRFRPELVVDGTAAAPGSVTAEVESLVGRASLARVRPRPGLRVVSGSLSFTVLSASAAGASGPGSESDPNGASVVGVGTVGKLSVLLTADAESPALLPLPLEPVDVIKVAHHGSSDPGLAEVLARTAPRVGVIETGPNPYGHPTDSTLRTASVIGRLLRTDLDGTVAVAERPDGSLVTERRVLG